MMTTINPIGVISMFYARPFTREHFSTFARMKAAGADVVELLVPGTGRARPRGDPARPPRTQASTIVLAARVNLTRDLASRDDEAHRGGVAYLESCVDIATALGARIVGGPLYGAPLVFAGRPPAPVDAGRAPAPDRRRRGRARPPPARRAADAGIVLGVESLNRFETDIANTAGHAIEIVDRVGSPGLGVMLDTFHMNMEEFDLSRAIRRTAGRLVHFQANENNRGFVGSGHIDWPGHRPRPATTSATRVRSSWSRSAATTRGPASRSRSGGHRPATRMPSSRRASPI